MTFEEKKSLRDLLSTYAALLTNHTKETDDIPALLAATDRALKLTYESRIQRVL